MSGRAPRRVPRGARAVDCIGLGYAESDEILTWLEANGLRHFVPEELTIHVTPRWLYLPTFKLRTGGYHPWWRRSSDGYLLDTRTMRLLEKQRVLAHRVPLRAISPELAERFGV